MASKIQLKKSNVTGRIPDPADLDWGEIALNYLDGKLFYKQHGTGTVQVLNTDTDTVTRLRGTASGTYASGDLTLLAGTNVSIAQSGTDITISANAAAEDPTKLPLTGGTVTGLVTFTHDNGSQGWSNIVIDASTAQNGAFIRANRASAATGEVGYAWGTAGTNQWINYLPINSTTLQWYQGTAVVMSLTAAGTLNASNLTANNNQVLHAANYNSYALPLTGGTLTGSLVISGIENALDVQHNGSSVAWRGRIISRNSDSDVATFLGNYNGKSGVFSHSNALNAWAPLYLNTLGSNGGNIVYLPHANTYTISGDNTTYLILDASNYSSYALPLTGGTMTGTLTGASGTTLSFSGGSGAADSYNYVLAAANDAGNRLVVFVNGSARSDDGGTNSVTIRNDGGTLNLGNSSHVTNLVGSSVVTATAAAGTNTTQVATTQFVQTAIANLVDTAPSTLDTLNELAAALGDDPNFATTVTNSLANKLNLTGGTLTGLLDIQDTTRSGSNNISGTVFYATSSVNDVQYIGQFRHQNQSQGIGFSYNSIRQTGSNENEQINLCSRGTGNLYLRYASTDSTVGTIGLTLLGTNGNVGINTTTPAEKLEVGGNILAFGSGSQFAGSGTNIWLGSTSNSRDIGFRRVDAGILAIDRYSGQWEESVRIIANGNIGINSTTPQYKLEVFSGNITTSGIAASVGSTIQAGLWTGIHFGFIQQNTTNYRKSALVFERQDGNARGTIHLLNNGTNDATSATISDSKLAIFYTGNVSIGGTNDNGYKLEVNGSFAATTKSFVIDHPTKPGKKLRYGSLEGPENGVYVRGRLRGTKIQLPDYWTKLVDPDSITVQLTPIGRRQDVWVTKIVDNCVHVQGITQPDCYYFVQAERVDVAKLEVEIE